MARSGKSLEKQQVDHRSVQLNPNSDAFWQARGYSERPSDWATRDADARPPEKGSDK